METVTPMVCVVGDDYSARESMDGLIRSAGFDVRTFGSIRDFLERRQSEVAACLVLAVRRPVSEGLNLLKSDLAQSGRHMPVLFVTSPGEFPTSLRALRTGATEFLSKPVRDEDLLSAIRRLTDGNRETSQADNDRTEDLQVAAQIQQGLMALTIPQPSFANISGVNLPCAEIGGDFITAVEGDDALQVAIADVAGKGIASAVMASALQGMIHEALRYNVPLPVIARDANEFMAERNLASRYATCVMARLRDDGLLEYLNCGHVPPLVVSKGAVLILPEANLPVGLIPDVEYKSATIQLSPGDRVTLVTDGVTEAESPNGDFFGYERLTLLAERGLSLDEIFNFVRHFCGNLALNDDCTIISLDYTGRG